MKSLITDNHHTHYEEFLSPTECEELAELALREEPRVMDIDNPYRDGSTYDGLTGQYLVYNWLSNPHVQTLNIPQRLFNLPDLKNTNHIAVQCWMNILRMNERILPHTHGDGEDSYSYASNIFLSGNLTTGTRYNDTGWIHNKLGEIHLCSNRMEHSVPSMLWNEPRISMAMDIWIDEDAIEDVKTSRDFPNSENRVIEFWRENESSNNRN